MIAVRRTKVGSKAFHRDSSGQAQVEFVLTILFVLLLFFGIIELIMLIYTYNVLADSAKEGVRYAIVHGCNFDSSNCSGTCAFAAPPPQNTCTDASGDNVRAWALNFARASLHDIPATAIAVNYPDGSSDAPNRVQVTVSYPYQPLFGLGWPTVTVRAAAEGRIVY